ncbi:MAG: hypothetical protein ABI672_19295 [Vicinamibacteria bacterium]
MDDVSAIRLSASKLAFLSLVLAEDYGRARQYLATAVHSSRIMLDPQNRAGSPQIFELLLDTSQGTHDPPSASLIPQPSKYGAARMSVRHFTDAFGTL